MSEELTKVEARQGDRRRMNMRVLFVAVPLAVLLMAAAYYLMV